MSDQIVHLIIHGRIQGVGYRAFVEHEATRRGLRGWVRNCRDGTVEAVIAGEAALVDDIIGVCRRGPPGSRVDALNRTAGDASALRLRLPGQAFSVLPTI